MRIFCLPQQRRPALVLEEPEGTHWLVDDDGDPHPYTGNPAELQPLTDGLDEVALAVLARQLVGVSTIARRAKVQRVTVHNWRQRHEDFPKPLPARTGELVFFWPSVLRWLQRPRPPGRPPQQPHLAAGASESQ